MTDYKKSMFGFGANSCVGPTKGDGCPDEKGCPLKSGAVVVVVGISKPRPVGRG